MSAAHPTDSLPTLAFVRAGWHAELVDRAQQGFLEVATAERAVVETFEVPGAFELPLHAQTLAETGRFDAIVAAGLVVDGGIYRHEFVANAILNGFVAVSTATEVPVLSAVLTPQRFDENDPGDLAFFAEHLVGKGIEIARSALEVVPVVRALRQEVR